MGGPLGSVGVISYNPNINGLINGELQKKKMGNWW